MSNYYEKRFCEKCGMEAEHSVIYNSVLCVNCLSHGVLVPPISDDAWSAESAAYDRYADKLLELLREAK